MNTGKLPAIFFFCYLFCFLSSALCPPIYAHGTKYEMITEGMIGVKAMFDSGVPMAEARTLIYSPGATEPAFEQKTDKQGRIFFGPDRAGTWILQVRDSGGHGMRINIEVTEDMTLSNDTRESHSFSIFQKIIMSVCILWGFAGTVLFFKGRKENDR